MRKPFTVPPRHSDAALSGIRCLPAASGRQPGAFLYLHGFGSSQRGEKAEFFRSRALECGFAFVSVDFQGHGESGGTMHDLTVSRCLRDGKRALDELLERGEGEPVFVFGSSLGGLVGLRLASEHPEAIAGAVAIAPAFGMLEQISEHLDEIELAKWKRDGHRPFANELGTYDLGWGFVDDLRRHEDSAVAVGYRVPTLIFQGKLDDRVPWRAVERFAQATTEATRLVLLEEGDHRLLEYRQEIWRQAVAFLSPKEPTRPGARSRPPAVGPRR